MAGLVAATIVIPLMLFGTPLVMPQKQTPLPDKLKPYAALYQRGQLNYTEVNHLHHGKVGMFLIGGEVVDTFQEAGHGVIVIKLGK